MRTFVFVIAFLCVAAHASFAAEKPVKGTTYTVSYNPADKGILTTAKEIDLVYAFDQWGTSAVQKMKGEEGSNTDLFENVLNPDQGAATTVHMTRQGNLWQAQIRIPFNAHLLSYYFTDNTTFDYNDKKTYVDYVCTADGAPVRDARFKNVDFLLMAGKDEQAVLDELQQEVSAYPDNLLAHMVYWRFKFFTTASPDTMESLVKESDAYFAKLNAQFGDTVLNYQARCLNDVNRVIGLSMSERINEPAVIALSTNVNRKILALIEAIPVSKRIASLAQAQMRAKSVLMTPEERKKQEEQDRLMMDEMKKMEAEFVGKPAPDFSFTTLDGASHKLSDFRGKYVLLDFWGTWCGPCVGEIPNLVKIHEKYVPKGLVMLSISSDQKMKQADSARFTNFVKAKKMAWMQVLEGPGGPVQMLYNIRFYPNMFLIDPEGNVKQRDKLRGADLEQTLSALPL